jgi:hypothetical protein
VILIYPSSFTFSLAVFVHRLYFALDEWHKVPTVALLEFRELPIVARNLVPAQRRSTATWCETIIFIGDA